MKNWMKKAIEREKTPLEIKIGTKLGPAETDPTKPYAKTTGELRHDGTFKIEFHNSYEIKDELGNQGFKFDGFCKTWYKWITVDEALELKKSYQLSTFAV